MTIVDRSLSNNSVDDDNFWNNKIHYLLIFNRYGICLFSLNLSSIYNIDENLISAFCSALISFSEEMIGNRVKTIEMGDKILSLIQNGCLFTGVLHELINGSTFIENKIKQVNNLFQEYLEINNINPRSQYIHDNQLNDKIRLLFSCDNKISSYNEKEINIIKYLKNILGTEQLDGILLFSSNGKLLFSTIDKSELNYYLKEIEFRIKIYNNSILKLFYTSHRNIIFSEYIEDSYYLILIFDLNIKFGLADHYFKKIVNNLKHNF